MKYRDDPRIALRATPEDQTNLATIAAAIREASRHTFLPASEAMRAALRAATILARRGQLDDMLRAYRADLAGH